MFDKIGRLAEAAATSVSVSRRGFFGQLGRGALVVAGALGGVLGAAAPARAGEADNSVPCNCRFGGRCQKPGTSCVYKGCGTSFFGYSYSSVCYWNCNGVHKTSKCSP
jgi:hypothetical protein